MKTSWLRVLKCLQTECIWNFPPLNAVVATCWQKAVHTENDGARIVWFWFELPSASARDYDTHPNGGHVHGLPLDGHVGGGENLLNGRGDLGSDAIAGDQGDLLGAGGVGPAGGGGRVDLEVG